MTHKRLHLLDELRGLTLISMMLYHFLWDLVYIAGISLPWYHSNGAFIWQQSICYTFILLSGFCWPFGHHPLKRGLMVFGGGALITLITAIFLPEDIVIFGVLTLIGSAMLLMIPIDLLLRKIASPIFSWFMLGVSFFLFLLLRPVNVGHLANFGAWFGSGSFTYDGPALPTGWYQNLFTAYLGFPANEFYSTDYFSLLPWFFLYLTGYFVHKLCKTKNGLTKPFLQANPLPPLAWIGRHCLLLYMLHQPVLYVITLLISKLMA